MGEIVLYILYGVLTLVLAVAFRRLAVTLRTFRARPLPALDLSGDVPSVTVCIPARNETHAMTECLERVTSSTYPKLEVLVLDDVSGDDTPALIKAFAQEGVRFVEGGALQNGWLGKNHALQELLQHASGTYIFYMDVDTRLAPDAIEHLVAYARQEDALMVSVLPRREDGWRASVLFSPLRYFWEVVFHRREAPATASNAWLIDRRVLVDRWRGFEAFKSAIQPESKFSAELMKEGRYRFVMGTEQLGIAFEKKWRSQIATSIRLLFPLLGARVANAIIAILDLLIISSPLFILLAGFFTGWTVHQYVALAFWLLYAGAYGAYTRLIWKRGWWLGALLWPLLTLQEAILIAVSVERYARNAVTWKGRRVRMSL